MQQLAECMQALARRPHDAELWCRVGFLYLKIFEVREALATFEAAQTMTPDHADAHYGASIAHFQLGDAAPALDCLRRARNLNPRDSRYASAYAYLCAATGQGPENTVAAYRDWARRFAEPLKPQRRPPPRRIAPGGKLRIGYLSGDYRRHALMNFLAPVLEAHDREGFELIAFSTGPGDETTASIRERFDFWNACEKLSDSDLCKRIRQRGIDVLVDLSGHTEGNRLLALARQPAPVQLTWFGYNGTTGMSAMDGRLTDAVLDPPGHEAWSAERLLRLPAFACFQAPAEAPQPGPLPALQQGYVRFVSLNNAQKLSNVTLECWGELLRRLPTARLTLIGLHAATAEAAQVPQLRARLQACGWRPEQLERLEILPQQPLDQFLRLGRSADIALEPWPLTGAVTTAQALWMGLPCVTLAGVLGLERAAAAILAAAGRPEWIVEDAQSYLQLAVALAGDLEGLAVARAGMREDLRHSVLFDYRGQAAALEAIFRAEHQRALDREAGG